MSRIESRYIADHARYEILGHINERDLQFSPGEIVLAVKRELVSSIVDHMMEQITPVLDDAIIKAFSQITPTN